MVWGTLAGERSRAGVSLFELKESFLQRMIAVFFARGLGLLLAPVLSAMWRARLVRRPKDPG
jgi:hypothetical protein